MLEIKVERKWSCDSVRTACIRNNFYTKGNNEDYSKMLEMVETCKPTTENIYKVAKDILLHSSENTIENIMYCLDEDAIHTFYEVNE